MIMFYLFYFPLLASNLKRSVARARSEAESADRDIADNLDLRQHLEVDGDDDVEVGVDDLRKRLEARALVESGWS